MTMKPLLLVALFRLLDLLGYVDYLVLVYLTVL